MRKSSSFFWVLKRTRKQLPALLLMTASSVGNAVLAVAFALGSRRVIDSAIGADPDSFFRACLLQGSIILGILICLALTRHLRERLAADLDRSWKKDLLHILLHGDFTSIRAYHSGELLNRLNNDVRTVDDGIISIIPDVAAMVAKLIAAVAVLVSLEPWFSVVVIIAGLFVIAATGVMRRHLKGINKQVSEEDGRVSGFIQETLEKLLMVQAMDVSTEMEHRADKMLEDRHRLQRKRKNISLFANTSVSVMYYGAGFAALVWCASGLLEGRITFGTLTAVIQLVNQLQSPFTNLSGVIPKYIALLASAERLMELEALENDPEPITEDPQELYRRADSIGSERLCFSYDRDHVLQNASFSLPKGSFTVITGPSGIGKSTILKLLLGIFRPESGRLFLNCEDGPVQLNRSTRRLFAYVPQGNLLLSGTLRENLILANPEASEEEITRALYVSAMDEYLPQLPMGLDTHLGESGAGLSEGQAQRLAIARAILSNAPILLLDESTSALDPHTEQIVLERIRALPGRTCIAVTHRPAAVSLCDWNLEMDDGRITVRRLSPDT